MHARVTIVEAPPERMDDATRYVQEQVMPRLEQMDGYKGMIALGDQQSGKLIGIALWENQEALEATKDAASRIREGVGDATGGTVAGVEEHEVAIFEVPR